MTGASASRIKFSQLRAFSAVARRGNFGEAALDLGLTQPTVSHAIATLEDELGVILVSRGRHGALLTPAGEDILKTVDAILGLLKTMEQQANRFRGFDGGRVRVASFRSAAANLLPEIVAQFTTQYPAVEVTITEHYDARFVEESLLQETADIGITFLPTRPEFESFELLRDPYVVLWPPTLPRLADALDWDALMTLPLILYPNDNSCFLEVSAYFKAAGYALEPQYQFRETSTILNMVAQGLGVAILPRLSAIALPSGVAVGQLPTPLERIVGVATKADVLHPPAVFAFLQVLRQHGAIAPQHP
ncbi:MAG: LysR family transcriptional regulator [Leptolyngbyaceae cyanobacterium T60_A2020_046]|nr:LysR family transcriptional regulator [Leptolyngbyaceae cyanobacterium T60_A2020_046]